MTNLQHKKTKSKQYHDKNSANFVKHTISSRKILLFNKPFDVLSQFTDQIGRQTLKNYIPITNVYATGRLDRDSEGLLILTNDGKLQAKLTQPNNKMKKIYYVQVEGIPESTSLQKFCHGLLLKDGMTKPAKAELVAEPD